MARDPASARKACVTGGGMTMDGERAFFLLALGCPKNGVGSGRFTSARTEAGWRGEEKPEDAELLVVNTRSFIVPAVEKSIEAVLETADMKENGARCLVVASCLVARYGTASLRTLLPEVDLFVEPGDYGRFEVRTWRSSTACANSWPKHVLTGWSTSAILRRKARRRFPCEKGLRNRRPQAHGRDSRAGRGDHAREGICHGGEEDAGFRGGDELGSAGFPGSTVMEGGAGDRRSQLHPAW